MFGKRSTILCRAGIIVLFIAALSASALYQNNMDINSNINQNYLYLTAEQRLSDFDLLCSSLDDAFPFWEEIKQAGIDKQELYHSYRKNIASTETDMEFFMCMNSFLSEFGRTGHLSILNPTLYQYYAAALSNDNIPPQSTANFMTAINNPVTPQTYDFLVEYANSLKTTSTETDSYENLTTSIYDDGKTAYLKINSFMITTLEQDSAAITDFYEQIKDTSNLIIDIRGNSGGSDNYWSNLIVTPNAKETLSSERYFLFNKNGTTWNYILNHIGQLRRASTLPEAYFSKYDGLFSYYVTTQLVFEEASNPYQGKIWVLVDDDVYSASENFAVFCKNTGFATLVGTPTGGDGGCMEPYFLTLPNSSLIIRFSAVYPINADGTGNEAYGTTPDIVISDDEDALEKCLSLIQEGAGTK